MIHQSRINHITHGYFFLTVVGLIIWIQMPDTYLIQLFGCHTTVYMFFVALLLGDLGATLLARICFLLWPVYILAFVVCYLIAVLKKKYKLLAAIAVIDVVFSWIIFLCYVQYAYLTEIITSFFGLCLSLFAAIALIQFDKQGIPCSKNENETNP